MIVIDTHVWLWWMNNDAKLKRAIRNRIDTETDVRVSAISLFELATAASRKRVTLNPSPREWLAIAQAPQQVQVEPLTDSLCLEATSLPGNFHRDPADRLIVALARLLNVELITSDGKILAYEHVRTLAAS